MGFVSRRLGWIWRGRAGSSDSSMRCRSASCMPAQIIGADLGVLAFLASLTWMVAIAFDLTLSAWITGMWLSFSAGQIQDAVCLVLADGAHTEAPKLRNVRSEQIWSERRDSERTLN